MLFPAQFLAVIGAATFAGAMLAIELVLGAFWRSLPAADFLVWFQAYSPLIQRTIPLLVVPTLVGLVGSVWLSWRDGAARAWWLAALACIAAVLLLTVVYFLPLNARFVTGGVPIESVPTALDGWLALHWLRITLALVAAALGMVAVARRSITV